MRGSSRLDGVPEYLSTRLMRTVAEARARGVDVISLGIGDPDTPPPIDLREEIGAQALRDDLHVYPSNLGIAPLREAVAAHYRTRFGVELDPEREIIPLLGAKEGLAHLCLAQLDPGDVALVADPGYPVYYGGPALAGGEAVGLPLREENGFLPDLDAVSYETSRRANLLICGYPNNPTGAVADVEFLERLAAWGTRARRGDLSRQRLRRAHLRRHRRAELPGRRRARARPGIEIYSLSKSLSMPGWRIAFAVGNAELIGRLRTLKTNIDSGMWLAEQHTAIRAIERVPSFTAELRELYGRRRDVLCDGLDALGPRAHAPERRALRVGARAGRRRLGGVRRAPARGCGRRGRARARPTARRATATCASR